MIETGGKFHYLQSAIAIRIAVGAVFTLTHTYTHTQANTQTPTLHTRIDILPYTKSDKHI